MLADVTHPPGASPSASYTAVLDMAPAERQKPVDATVRRLGGPLSSLSEHSPSSRPGAPPTGAREAKGSVELVAGERSSTEDLEYAQRLERLQSRWWKRVFDVQAPYRRYLRRLGLGSTLDLGCGIGRTLRNLEGRGVGVDHNVDAVAVARRAGFVAYTPTEFKTSEYAQLGRFDSLLVAHVIEHMTKAEAVHLLHSYLEYVRPDGTVVLITPQERGFRSDTTHVEFMDFAALGEIARRLELEVTSTDSFPFPRMMGKAFIYNEFVTIARRTVQPQ